MDTLALLRRWAVLARRRDRCRTADDVLQIEDDRAVVEGLGAYCTQYSVATRDHSSSIGTAISLKASIGSSRNGCDSLLTP